MTRLLWPITAIALFAVATAACSVPAMRAPRIDPAVRFAMND